MTAVANFSFAAAKSKTPTPIIYVASVTDSNVTLYWTDAVNGELDWTLERATISTGPFTVIAQLAPNTTNYVDNTVLPGTTYYYRAGYLTSKGTMKVSGTLKVKTQAKSDATPPTVTVTAPVAGEILGGTATLSASATDNVSVSSVEFFVDGISVGRDTNSPYSISFDTRTVSSGSHSLVAKAKDPAGNTGTSAGRSFIVDNTAPTVPANVSATAASCSQVNISWSASTDAGSGLQSYVVFRNGAFLREVSASSTSTIDTSVSASTAYTYSVAAKDNYGYQSVGSSPSSVTVPSCSDTTVPSAPTNLVATAVDCTQVDLKWNASTDSGGSGLKGYEVYRSGVYIGLVLAPATNLIDTGVAPGTTYSYRVSSLDNADNFSALSSPANAAVPTCPDFAAPTVPGNFAATATSCSQVSISWSASTDSGSGVQSYLVFRNGTLWREVSAATLSTSDTTVSPSTTYSYYVAAKDVAGNQSGNTASVNVTVPACPDTTAPSIPANVVATAASCSQVNVSWSASTDSGSGVQSYLVYRNGAFWREVATLSTTDATVSGATSYSYSVAAKDVAGNQSAQSTSSSATTPVCPDTTNPTVPSNVVAVAVNCAQASISWKASTDAGGSGLKGYEIYRNGVYIGLVMAPSTNLVDSGVAASTSYSYRVSSIDNAGNISALSSAANVTTPACPDTTAPTVPSNLAATATSCSQVSISWSASTDSGSGVQSYVVYKNGTLWREVSAPALSTIDTAVSPSTSYSYAVAAKDVAGNQSASTAAVGATVPPCPDTTAPTVPGNVAATAPTCSQVNISWSASTDAGSGVQSYVVYKNGSLWREVSSTALSTTDTSVSASTSYSYAVAAKDVAGNQSATSAASGVTLPACPDTTAPTVPTNLVATAINCSQVSVTWKASTDTGGSGLKGYDIYRNGVYIGQVLAPATNLTDNGVAASTAYSYRVSAFDNAGNDSALSATAATTTPACPDTTAPTVPGNVAASATSCSAVTVSWSASTDAGSGVLSYLVYKNGTFWREVSSTALSTTDTSVSASTSYSYAVAAKDAAGNQSANSTAAGVTTPACPDTTAPTVPANVVASVASCSRVDVSWAASTDASSGVKGYRVYRNGTMLQEVLSPALTFSDTTAAASTVYSYQITAFDNAGNVSGMSTSAGATTPTCGGVPGRFVAVTLLGATDSDYGMAVATDSAGNFVAGGSVAGRPYFAKLSPSRQIIWSYALGSAGSVQAVALDPNGDVVVAGFFYATADFGAGPVASVGGYDLFVAKYSSSGALRWANRYGSPQGADFAGDETANSVAIDSNGNIAVAGSFLDTVDFGNGPFTTRGGKDGFILKLNSSGIALWSKTFGNSGTDDSATSVRFDAANNLFVGGRFSVDVNLGGTNLVAAGSYDALVAKFSPTGAHLWSKRTGGTSYDTVRDMAVDPAGDLLITGDYRIAATFDGVAFTGMGEEDVFLVKYTGSSGVQQWAKSFGSWNTDSGYAVNADSQRNIVIAGRLGAAMNFGGGNVSTPRNGFNIYIAKFDPTGTHLWSKALGNGREEARGIAFGNRDYPFIVGRLALTNNFGSGVFTNYGNNLNPDMMVLELEP